MASTSLCSLISCNNSALGMHMFNYLDAKDTHQVIQTSHLLKKLYIERSGVFIKHADVWSMRGWYSLVLYKQFMKRCMRWIGPLTLVTEISDITIILNLFTGEDEDTPFLARVDINSKRIITNTACMEDGSSVLKRYAEKDSNLSFFLPSISTLAKKLNFLHVRAGVTEMKIDGVVEYIPDLTIVTGMEGSARMTTFQACSLLYHWLAAFSRETSCTYDKSTEWGYCILRRLVDGN